MSRINLISPLECPYNLHQMPDTQFRMPAFYRAKKPENMFKIIAFIASGKKGFGKYHSPVLEIKRNHYNRYPRLFCDVIKTSSQTIDLFTCAFG